MARIGLFLFGKDRAVRVEQGKGCYCLARIGLVLLGMDMAVRVEQG